LIDDGQDFGIVPPVSGIWVVYLFP
jgi:hypothetical protein